MLNKFHLTLIFCFVVIGIFAQTITENGDLLGLKNSSGEVILEPKYEEVVRYRTFCRYTPVYSYALNGKHGIICHPDSTGYTDSGLIYDSVYYSRNCIVIEKDGKLGIVYELRYNIFRCGTPRYDSIVPMFGDWNPEDGDGIKHFYDYNIRELQVRIGKLWGIADYHSDSLLVSPVGPILSFGKTEPGLKELFATVISRLLFCRESERKYEPHGCLKRVIILKKHFSQYIRRCSLMDRN